jgi:hypothetical protein
MSYGVPRFATPARTGGTRTNAVVTVLVLVTGPATAHRHLSMLEAAHLGRSSRLCIRSCPHRRSRMRYSMADDGAYHSSVTSTVGQGLLAAGAAEFVDGVAASLAFRRMLPFFERSKTVRTRTAQCMAFGFAQVAVGVLVAGAWPTVILHGLWARVSGVPLEPAGGVDLVDRISVGLLFCLWGLPLYVISLLLGSVRVGQLVTHAANRIKTSSLARRDIGVSGDSAADGQAATATTATALTVLSETIYRMLLLGLMNAYVVALDVVPGIGRPLSLSLCSLVLAFTACDAVWCVDARPVAWRIAQVEAHWPWFLGFGSVITLLSFFGSFLVNAGAYLVSIPWLCVLAIAANVGQGLDAVVADLRPRPDGRRVRGVPRLPVLWPFQWCALWAAKSVGWVMAVRRNRKSG